MRRRSRMMLQKNVLILFCLTLLLSPFGTALSGSVGKVHAEEDIYLEIERPSDNSIVTVTHPEYGVSFTKGADIEIRVRDSDGRVVEYGEAKNHPGGYLGWTTNSDLLAYALSDGEYTIEATATKDGKSITKTSKFTVVLPDPELTIERPSDNSIVTATHPEYGVSFTKGADIEIRVRDSDGRVVEYGEAKNHPGGYLGWTTNSDLLAYALSDGEYTIEATATKDGKSTTKTSKFTVVLPEPDLVINEPSGDKVFVATPEFTGTTTPGATVTVQIKAKDDNVIDTPIVTVNPDGSWTFTPSKDLEDDVYTVEVKAVKDGKTTIKIKEIEVDTSPPLFNITVKHVDKYGEKIAPDFTLTGELDEPYETEAKKIDGYTLTGTPENATGTFTAEEQEVIFVYTKDEEVVADKEITARYYDWVPLKTGYYEQASLPLPEKVEVLLNDGSKVELEVIWRMDSDPVYDKDTFGGYLFSGDFKLIDGITNPDGYLAQRHFVLSDAEVNVTHVDEDGDELAPEETLTGKVNDEYTTEAKEIDSYTLTETPANASGKFTVRDINVQYVYEKNLDVPTFTVTVTHVDEYGKKIESDVILTGELDEPYATEAKDIEGYMLTETPSNATGTFGSTDKIVEYLYERDSEVPLYSVIVTHKDEEGNKLDPGEILTGKMGDPYETEAKEIDGYTLTETPSNASGEFQDVDQTVTYVYKKDEVSEETEGPKESAVEEPSIPMEPGDPVDEKTDKEDDPIIITTTDDSSGQLPKTATSYYTILFVGFLLTLLGGAAFFIVRRKRVV